MPQTLFSLLPFAQRLAAPGVAGIVASLLFAQLRLRVPTPASAPTARWQRWLLLLLYAPRWSRYAVLLLAFVLGLAAQALICVLTGTPVLPTVDAALAGALSAVASQLAHGYTDLSGVLPTAQAAPRDLYAATSSRLNARGEQ